MTDLDDAYRRYRRRVRRYGRSWHRTDVEALEQLASSAAVRSQVIAAELARKEVSTEDVYRIAGRWLPQRLDLHEAVLRDVLGPPQRPVPAGRRLAVLLLGLPGSGKSRSLRPIAQELVRRIGDAEGVVVDADVVRAALPEYAGGLGSSVVQAEAAYLTYDRVIDAAHRSQSHVIFDMVGDPAFVVGDVQYLSAAGWGVVCLAASVDVAVAVERVKRRAVEQGRYVPVDYVRRIGSRWEEAYDLLADPSAGLVATAMLDTADRVDGPPVIVRTDRPEVFGAPGEPTGLWPRRGAT